MERELLPVPYFHLVFSVPHALVPLIWQIQAGAPPVFCPLTVPHSLLLIVVGDRRPGLVRVEAFHLFDFAERKFSSDQR